MISRQYFLNKIFVKQSFFEFSGVSALKPEIDCASQASADSRLLCQYR